MNVLKLTDFWTDNPIFINFQEVQFFERLKNNDGKSYTYIQLVVCSTKVKEDPETIQRLLKGGYK